VTSIEPPRGYCTPGLKASFSEVAAFGGTFMGISGNNLRSGRGPPKWEGSRP